LTVDGSEKHKGPVERLVKNEREFAALLFEFPLYGYMTENFFSAHRKRSKKCDKKSFYTFRVSEQRLGNAKRKSRHVFERNKIKRQLT
jgi:hypothetical protein